MTDTRCVCGARKTYKTDACPACRSQSFETLHEMYRPKDGRRLAVGQRVGFKMAPWSYGFRDGIVPAEVLGFTTCRVKVRLANIDGEAFIVSAAADNLKPHR